MDYCHFDGFDLDAPRPAARALEAQMQCLRAQIGRLTALGYESTEAAYLAISGIDIDELERLIEKGCPRKTAVRIAA